MQHRLILGDLCISKCIFSSGEQYFGKNLPTQLWLSRFNYLVICGKKKLKPVDLDSYAPSNLFCTLWIAADPQNSLFPGTCCGVSVSECEFSKPILNEHVHEELERIERMHRILMEIEKELWGKPICHLCQATLYGVTLPLTVMHCKSDWLVWYWEIVHLNCLLLPKWWNYCTLVFESIIAD